MWRMTPKDALAIAIDAAGGQSALARTLSTPARPVRQGHVWSWLNRQDGNAPAELILAIEAACKACVTRYQLRPDVYGVDPALAPEHDSQPEAAPQGEAA